MSSPLSPLLHYSLYFCINLVCIASQLSTTSLPRLINHLRAPSFKVVGNKLKYMGISGVIIASTKNVEFEQKGFWVLRYKNIKLREN